MKKSLILYLSLAVLLFSSVGKIAVTKGEVSVLRSGETLPASSGFELLEKDTVITGAGARAQLVFNDETVVSVGKGSEFLVDEYLFTAGADAEGQTASFRSLKGAFKTITGKIGKVAPEKFKLATKTATIGIRGTHFLGKINIDGDKIACTHGAISVAAFAGGDPVVVPAGQITTVLAGAMPTPPRKYTASELSEMNEASGAATEEEAAEPEAAAEGGEAAQAEADEGEEAEPDILVDAEPMPLEEPPLLSGGLPLIPPTESPVPRDLPPAIPSVPDLDPDDLTDLIGPTGDAYPMTYIAGSGPIDMYGKSMESAIGSPDCENGDCSVSSTTAWADYFYNGTFQLYRDGTYVAVNEGGAGNYGVETDYEVQPTLGTFQSFTIIDDGTSTDGYVYLGQAVDITGVQMMSSAAGNYEGYNAEYRLDSYTDGEDQWAEDNYITYDNLGEFAIVTSETVDPAVDGEMYRDALYAGKKSSWDFLSEEDAPDHLIYKMLMSYSISYDGSGNFDSYMYNGLATGTDYSGSRLIGNTRNGNVLYVGRPQNDGRGWGVIIGTAAQGSSSEVMLDGSLYVWNWGNKDIDGNYYVESDVVIDGTNGAEIDGELYGSQLQGFGMSISSTSPTVFGGTPSANPGAFDASLIAGYRTDDAGQINLDTLLTGTATMSGFAASRSYISDSSTGTVNQTDIVGGVIDSLVIDRDTGSISGTISLGGTITDGSISSPYASLAVSGTGGQTSAFISDDYFASTLGSISNNYYDIGAPTPVNGAGGIMATNPGFALDDVTWGYWTAAYTDGSYDLTYHHKSTWVAGIDTAASKIAEIVSAAGGAAGVEVYTFEGKLLGRIYGNGPSGTINSDASWVRISVDFGSTTPVSGSMVFTAVDYPELVWYVDIDSTGSTLNTTSGYMNAALSGNSNSIVMIGSNAGELHADLYGANGTSIGGQFEVTGTIDKSHDLTAIGVFKGATDQSLTAPVVGDQKILVGNHFSTWIDDPASGTEESWREATQTSGSGGGFVENSAFYISVDGDTGTYRNFGQIAYSITHDGTGFAMDTPELEDMHSGALTIGTVTAQDVTTMITAVGGYTGISAEDLTSGDDKKFVVYDNLRDFFIILESSNANADGEAARSLLYAGTPFESMSGESNLIGYSMVASVELTLNSGEFSSGAYSPLLSGDGVLAKDATFVLNRSNNLAVFVGTPYDNGDGTYSLESIIGSLDQTTGTVSGQGYYVDSGGQGGIENYGYSLADAAIYGSANQGLGITINNPEELINIAGIRTETPAGATLNPATDTDGSTGTVTWTGSVAGIKTASTVLDSFEHGIITDMDIDRTSGALTNYGYLQLGLVDSGVVEYNEEISMDMTSSAYVSDDYIVVGLSDAYSVDAGSFSAADGGGIMVTAPDGVEDDFASWGYWGASYYNESTMNGFEFIPVSTWVAGNVVDVSGLSSSMDFTGQVLGHIGTFDNSTEQLGNFQLIDTASSVVDLHVDFGQGNPIKGTITFNPVNDSAMTWKMDVGSNTITASTNGSFDAQLSVNDGSAVVIGNAEMHGHFYGNTGGDVTSLGGSFAAGGLYGSNAVGAAGVIKATRD